MSYDPNDQEQEAKDWWDQYGDQVDDVIEDEINGDDVISLDDLDEDEQPTDDDPYDTYEDDED